MQRFLLIILFLISVMTFFGQGENRSPVTVEGRILDESRKPIAYVNILIKSRLTGTVGDYYGNYRITAFPGDTMTFSAVSYRRISFIVPGDMKTTAYSLDVLLENDTVGLKEVVIYPWPSTYKQFKEEFLELEVEDPLANLDLHLPSMKDLSNLMKTPGIPGQIGLYSGPGPFSLLYDQFSKEARSKRMYADVLRREKAGNRYNKIVVSRVTGLKDEEEIADFMKFCPLDVRFILGSTDYELYLAIRNCYIEFAHLNMPQDSISH